MQGSIAKVVREPIKKDASLQQCVYNTTAIPWNAGKMEFPDSGIYWFIPFDNNPVFMIIHEVCTECSAVYTCSSGSCSWVTTGGGCEVCDCGSTVSNPCQVTQTPCFGGGGTSGVRRVGGGVIIQAANIQMQEEFYSALVDTPMFCKITVQYDNNTNIVHYRRTFLDKVDWTIGQTYYNLTTIPLLKDNVMMIPKTGHFWFIPFDPGNPVELENGGELCYTCYHTAGANACSTNDDCDFRPNGGGTCCKCGDGSTVSCTSQRCKCDGAGTAGSNVGVRGGGIILPAEDVTF